MYRQTLLVAGLLAGSMAAPHSSGLSDLIHSLAKRLPIPQTTSSACTVTDGSMVCSDDGAQWGICSSGQVVFQDVAAGTICKDGTLQVSGSSGTPAEPSAVTSAPPETTTGPGEHYKIYLGNGEPSQGWPEHGDWGDFEDMWSKNLESIIKTGCQSGQQNTPENNADLKEAIHNVSKSSDVDARFILAIVLQESSGCVRVQTTANAVSNPGLMQDYNGTHTCYNKTVCPKSEIYGMIHDGVYGTDSSKVYGYKHLLEMTNTTSVAKYYRAAHMYNSGLHSPLDKLQCSSSATSAYSNDVANRLTLAWYRGDAPTIPETGCYNVTTTAGVTATKTTGTSTMIKTHTKTALASKVEIRTKIDLKIHTRHVSPPSVPSDASP